MSVYVGPLERVVYSDGGQQTTDVRAGDAELALECAMCTYVMLAPCVLRCGHSACLHCILRNFRDHARRRCHLCNANADLERVTDHDARSLEWQNRNDRKAIVPCLSLNSLCIAVMAGSGNCMNAAFEHHVGGMDATVAVAFLDSATRKAYEALQNGTLADWPRLIPGATPAAQPAAATPPPGPEPSATGFGRRPRNAVTVTLEEHLDEVVHIRARPDRAPSNEMVTDIINRARVLPMALNIDHNGHVNIHLEIYDAFELRLLIARGRIGMHLKRAVGGPSPKWVAMNIANLRMVLTRLYGAGPGPRVSLTITTSMRHTFTGTLGDNGGNLPPSAEALGRAVWLALE